MTHPRLRLWADISDALIVAARSGTHRIHSALRSRRPRSHLTRRPGAGSPMWNVCAGLFRRALQPYGAKARLARHLGIPRQRLNDFLHSHSRLPDAELTLQLLHWYSELRAGRDLTL